METTKKSAVLDPEQHGWSWGERALQPAWGRASLGLGCNRPRGGGSCQVLHAAGRELVHGWPSLCTPCDTQLLAVVEVIVEPEGGIQVPGFWKVLEVPLQLKSMWPHQMAWPAVSSCSHHKGQVSVLLVFEEMTTFSNWSCQAPGFWKFFTRYYWCFSNFILVKVYRNFA